MQDTNCFLELLGSSADRQCYDILVRESRVALERLIRYMSRYELQMLLDRELDFLPEKSVVCGR